MNHSIAHRLNRFRLKARARRGVTLVEVLIVVAIMAIIAGGATILVFPAFKKAKIESAKVGCKAVHSAAQLYVQTEQEGDECPTIAVLVQAKKLDAKTTDDPWGQPYRVVCEDADTLHVYSNGNDRKEGTPDDVREDFKASDVKRVADL